MDAKRNRWLTNSFAAIVFLGFFLLSACGGGSSNPPPPPPGTTAPSGLSYQTPQAFTIGQAITALSPTVTGTVSSYSVSPTLPAGLTLSASGVISGTPTAAAAQAKYTVTASNSAGSTTVDLTITVNDVKPQVSYSASTVAMATGLPITPLRATTTAGTVTSWSISPALPTGLSFSTTDGSISGTPTATSAAAAYTVTATNSGGSATFTFTLSVQSATLLDLGHADPISVLRFDGTKVMSADIRGHWVLWNYAAGTHIASGDSGCSTASIPFPCNSGAVADFAGSVIALLTHTGFEVRSATDGHVVTTITSTIGSTTGVEYWQLAPDGSYLVAWDTAALQVWSTTTGATLASKKGSYLYNGVYAALGQIQAAIVSGGQHVIETTSVSTGASTNSSAFNGTFQTWFADGNRFLSSASNTVLTYSAAAVQQDVTTVPGVAQVLGTGNWFGSFDGSNLSIYKVGASSSPAATYGGLDSDYRLSASGSMFIAQPPFAQVTIIDLSGATPARTDSATPVSKGIVFAGISPTQWLSGTSYGVIFDGASGLTTPRYLGYGEVWSIAGAGTRFAISTASGRILHYDSTTNTLEGTIQDFSSKLVLSADGTVVAALGDTALGSRSQDASAKVYSLPGGGVVSTWPGNSLTGPDNISLSASGTVLGLAFVVSPGMSATHTASTYPVTGGAAIWTGNCAAPYMPTNASNIACAGVAARRPQDGPFFGNENLTGLYNNGALVTALTGVAVGWVDDGHLLVNNYADNSGQVTFQGVSIIGPTGTVLSTPGLPEMLQPQPVTATSVYTPTANAIVSVTDGHVIWFSPDTVNYIGGAVLSPGAVAGNDVVFASGAQVIALSH
ncbi:MAG: putative Ig [Bryobacterales bacterium]|nr:putative Ig [Bryobacterales bacterium]